MYKLLQIVTLCVFGVSARGQALLSFDGGSGQRLSLTLNAPVIYRVTSIPSSGSATPIFNFQGVGDLFSRQAPQVFGSIAYSVDGGTPRTISFLNSGFVGGDVRANDLYAVPSLTGSQPLVSFGQTVSLLAGTVTTVAVVQVAAPPSGTYSTFLSESSGTAISGPGLSVPEPRVWSILAAGALFFGVCRQKRISRLM